VTCGRTKACRVDVDSSLSSLLVELIQSSFTSISYVYWVLVYLTLYSDQPSRHYCVILDL
jgi:hypothetical protein